MARCQNCGKKYGRNDQFCQQCGAPFQYGYPQPGASPYAPYPQQPPRRSGCAGKGCLIAVIAVVVLASITLAVLFYFARNYGFFEM